MIKIVAIANFYADASWRVGLLDIVKYPDTKITVIIPSSVVHKNASGYNKLLKDGFVTKHFKSIFNFHHSVRLYLHQLYVFLHQEKPDIIFVTNETWSITALQIVLWCKFFFKKTKIIVYTLENQVRKYPFPFNFIEKFVLKNIYQVVTGIKDESINILRKKKYTGNTVYLPFSVDTDFFRKIDYNKDELKIPSNKIIIGYVGRIVKEKGVELILDALKILGDNYYAVFIGNGSYINELVDYADTSGVTDRFSIFQDVPRSELPKYYSAMNVFVLPSLTTPNWKEQFGRVLIEAMACETPVVGSSSGEIPTVIGDCGVIFDEGNSHSFADSILKALKHSHEYGSKGKERAQANFSKEVVDLIAYKNYIDILK